MILYLIRDGKTVDHYNQMRQSNESIIEKRTAKLLELRN